MKWVGIPGGELWNSDPGVSVFAAGYKPGGARRDPILERGKGFRRVSPLNGRDIKLKHEMLDDEYVAKIWSDSVRRITDAGDCSVAELPALRLLLERLEPQYDKLLWEGFRSSGDHFRYAIKRCAGEG